MRRSIFILCKTLAAACLALAAGSCISDRNDTCPAVVTVRFSYTFNADNEELFSEEVKEVVLYLFDRNDLFLTSVTLDTRALGPSNSYRMDLEAGSYKMIAWGNLDSQHFTLLGDGDRSAMGVQVATDDSGETPCAGPDLFYGTAAFEAAGLSRTEATVSLVRDTKQINILIPEQPGTRTIPGTDVSVRICGSNGIINFDNNTAAMPATYKPEYSKALYEGAVYDLAAFRTFKLCVGDDTSIRIYIDGQLRQQDELVDLITSNFPQIQTDRDLERYSEYTFVYEIDDNGTPYISIIQVDQWSKTPGQQGGI